MREGYAVTVTKWGEPILTIEHECLSGSYLSDDDKVGIRTAGQSLIAFIGPPPDGVPGCVVCCDDPDFCICMNTQKEGDQ